MRWEIIFNESSWSFQCWINELSWTDFLLFFLAVMKSTSHHRVCKRSAFYPKICSSKIWKAMIFLCHPNTKSIKASRIVLFAISVKMLQISILSRLLWAHTCVDWRRANVRHYSCCHIDNAVLVRWFTLTHRMQSWQHSFGRAKNSDAHTWKWLRY